MSDSTPPRKGDAYTCKECGMAILVTTDCACEDGEPFFACCGTSMDRNEASSD